jgi:hypothetical protein
MLHRPREVVFKDGMWYTAPNAADEAILNKYIYRDDIKEPKPNTKLKPRQKQPTKRRTEAPSEDSPPHRPEPKKNSRALAGLETSLGDAWKKPGEGSPRNHAGKDMLAESAQLALKN